jgi:1-hydroxycarotenoid 3,4-desaturase
MSASSPPSGARHIIIVGAGVGGLAAAVRLLAAGYRVTILERLARPGGKMRQIAIGDKLFDGGPSVLTLPWVLDDLCAAAGVKTADLITLSPLEPLCRHFFADGTKLDLFADQPGLADDRAWARSAGEISRVIGTRAAEQYGRFRRHAAVIYRAVERPFMRSPLPSHPLGFVWQNRITDVQALCHFFDDERLRMLFARYATYSGADPFSAPATLSVIPHVELAFGVQAVQGGMYRVAEALTELVLRLGGTVRTQAEVERIELDAQESRVLSVEVAGERLPADCVIVNTDVAQLHARLLSGTRRGARLGKQVDALPPSLSAYLNLCVATDAGDLPLLHHNVFFSSDYRREFAELGSRPPTDPTVYLCNPDFSQATQRWFFLTNAPSLPISGDGGWQWTAERRRECRQRVIDKLGRHGIDFTSRVVGPSGSGGSQTGAEVDVTPRDFADLFPCSRGALYGAAASSRMAAFKRPPNRVPGIANLFCVGGSTHPGAGVPMVMLSAQIVCGLVEKTLK